MLLHVARIVVVGYVDSLGALEELALDLDGHHWLFSRRAGDLSHDQWGATLSGAPSR